jgi:hypothetical protein
VRSQLLGAIGALVLLAAAPAGARAATVVARTVEATGAHAASCQVHAPRSAPGMRTLHVTAPQTGLLRATLSARGDWDLAIFDATSKRTVAASAAPTGDELAEGFVAAGEPLLIQACRRDGASPRARLTATTVALGREPAGPPAQVVTVATPDGAARDRLAALGLDPAEAGGTSGADVVLHGEQDAAALRRAGLSFTVKIADPRLRAGEGAAEDGRRQLRAAAPALPSGRLGYRRLADYESELRSLAERHPGLVKLITLPYRSLEGRPILGVEIAHDVNVEGGQPVYVQLGVHHAREWPSGELPMEFAVELVNGYGRDERITRLVNATRTVVVPIVNPDGFTLSREWPADIGAAVAPIDLPAQVDGLLPITDPLYTAALLADAGVSPAPGTGFSYKRRNCRVADGRDPAPGECESLANRRLGVDPNRNYGGSWGGAGAALDVEDDTYRGAAPFSEPEVQNVRELVSGNQVTTLVTNHTYGNLILRPPGLAAMGDPPDEALYRALGDAMAAKNGYTSQHSFALYDTSGATEDWSYYATGGLGFTFEIGPDEFHPPFAETVAEYARNREAYFVAMESAADSARHAVVEGRGPPGTILRAHKEFDTDTAPVIGAGGVGLPRTFHDVLDTTMTIGASGRFAWHLNPSTRPRATSPEAWTVTCERPAGTVLARGTLVIARGERTALDLCALRFSVALERRPLEQALGRGLRARARCSAGCAATATLTVDGETARRYGLRVRRSGRVVVARGSAGRAFRGARRFHVHFTAPARRRLRGVRRLRLRLRASAAAGGTDRRSVTRTVVLRRGAADPPT